MHSVLPKDGTTSRLVANRIAYQESDRHRYSSWQGFSSFTSTSGDDYAPSAASKVGLEFLRGPWSGSRSNDRSSEKVGEAENRSVGSADSYLAGTGRNNWAGARRCVRKLLCRCSGIWWVLPLDGS